MALRLNSFGPVALILASGLLVACGGSSSSGGGGGGGGSIILDFDGQYNGETASALLFEKTDARHAADLSYLSHVMVRQVVETVGDAVQGVFDEIAEGFTPEDFCGDEVAVNAIGFAAGSADAFELDFSGETFCIQSRRDGDDEEYVTLEGGSISKSGGVWTLDGLVMHWQRDTSCSASPQCFDQQFTVSGVHAYVPSRGRDEFILEWQSTIAGSGVLVRVAGAASSASYRFDVFEGDLGRVQVSGVAGGAYGQFDYQGPPYDCEGALLGGLYIDHGANLGKRLELSSDCDDYDLSGDLNDDSTIVESFPWPTAAFAVPVI